MTLYLVQKKYSVSKGPFVYNSKTSPTCGEKLSPPMDVAEKLPLYYEVAASEKIQAVEKCKNKEHLSQRIHPVRNLYLKLGIAA